jgi:hypothetical protein
VYLPNGKGIAAFDNTSATMALNPSVPKLVTVMVIMPSEAGPLLGSQRHDGTIAVIDAEGDPVAGCCY